MKILINGINYSPELTGIGKYSGEMAEWLAAHGHEVRVVTAPPYYPEWRVAEGYSGARYKREFVTASEAQQSRDLAPAAADGSVWIAMSAAPVVRLTGLLRCARIDGVAVIASAARRSSGLKRHLIKGMVG